MRALTLSLVLSTLAVAAGCDSGPRDPDLAAQELTTANLTAAPETSVPVQRNTARPSTAVRQSSTATTTRRSTTTASAPQTVVVTHRHTKRDAAIGAGAGAVVGGLTHGTKGAIVGGILGGAAGAIIGHKVDKKTTVETR